MAAEEKGGGAAVAENGAGAAVAERGQKVQEALDLLGITPKEPGAVTQEELSVLYTAAEIKVRGLNEQLESATAKLNAWGALGGTLMEILGVDQIDAVIPAVEKLNTNRQARRSQKKPGRK